MLCPNCGTENRAGRKFCAECGTTLALACPACGTPYEPGEKFCGECGTALAGGDGRVAAVAVPAGVGSLDRAVPAPPAGLTQPAAERRLVSVLFADLVGFTTLSESRDSEEVRELLSSYFETSRTLIARYGGVVEKFIGDAVMAVWGTPVATEDDAERAVRAALDLTKAVALLGEEAGAPDLQARAGVLTGEAAVTIGAEGEGMVAGDMVNTAARIQSAAPPGGVLVGDATRRATESAIAYEDAGAHELKGKVGLTHLSRALRVVAGAGGTLKSAGLEAPFVGRDRELRMAKDLFHASADEHISHLVSVIGIAGIGKSRLAWEFYKYFDGLADTTYWHRGRCLAYGEGVTYWALAEMVKMRARISEEEAADQALAKLRATIEEHVEDPEERRWLESRLAHLLGIEERSATADREDLFAAWRRFFERLSATYPVVMVFEDMQWADSSLLDFIEHLMEWSRAFPLFVVTLARPELLERRSNWGAGKRNFTSLYLDPLSPQAMEDLLTGLVPGLPEDLHRRILDRAEGVPLYAVETVRMLLDRGLLAQEGSVYRPTGPIDALEVPETLHALIAARLDGLTGDERLVVQDGAVLGKTFYPQALAAITGLGREDLEPILASLVRKEVLSIQADPRSPEHGQYGFLQDLVKRVAYETLSKKERKAKHLAAAAFLEEAWGAEEEEIAEVLASHFLEAFESAPDADDAPAIRGRAREALIHAGERAEALAASGEAQRYYGKAAELSDDGLVRAELNDRAGQMAFKAGRVEDAVARYEAAVGAFEGAGEIHRAARTAARLAEVDFTQGRVEDAVARLEPAYEVMSREEPDEDLAIVAGQLGRFLMLAGRTDVALERLEEALALSEALRLPEVFAHALNSKSIAYSRRDRLDESRILLRGALEVALENDLAEVALRTYNNIEFVNECMDRLVEEMEDTDRALELARRVGDRLREVSLLVGSIHTLVLLGRWDQALAWADEGVRSGTLETAEVTRAGLVDRIDVFVHRGEMDRARQDIAELSDVGDSEEIQARTAYAAAAAGFLNAEGRHRDAMDAAEMVIAVREELGITHPTFRTALVAGVEAALGLGDLAKTEELIGIVDSLQPGRVAPSLRAQVSRLKARLAILRGSQEPVEPGFKSAAGLFRELGFPFSLAVTLLEHGEWLVSQGRSESAEPLLAEARGTFEELGAKPWLERVDALGAMTSGEVGAGTGA